VTILAGHSFSPGVSVSCLHNRIPIFRLVFVMTPNAPPFSLENPLYSEQLRLNVPVNVYFDGKWGSYRVIPLSMTIGEGLVSNVVVQPHATANG